MATITRGRHGAPRVPIGQRLSRVPLCLLLAAGVASAQPAPREGVSAAAPAGPPAAQPSPADQRADQASGLLQTALVHRRAGDREAALEALQRAYRLAPQPSYLVLMAEIEQEAGHDREALALYQRYLKAAPAAADRLYVQEQIEELQRPAAAPLPLAPRRQPSDGAAPLRAADLQPQPAPLTITRTTSAPPAREPRPGKLVWILTAAGVVAAAGVAVGLGIGLRPAQPTFLVAPGAQP